MIYVLRYAPDVYSGPFLRNQETKRALAGQQGLWVRGHISCVPSVCAFQERLCKLHLFLLFWQIFFFYFSQNL